MKLNPCPFCMGNNVSLSGGVVYYVFCSECKTCGPESFKTEDAEKGWNSRPGEDEAYDDGYGDGANGASG